MLLLFNLDPDGRAFADALARELGASVAPHEERVFDDAECKLRPLVDPQGADCHVLLSTHGGPTLSPHDKLWRLLSFCATLRDHGAARVSAVVPYLAYARKDRRTQPHDPLGQRVAAQLIEAVGVDRLVVLEAHNVAALQNAFRIPVVHVDVRDAFDGVVDRLAADGAPLVVASPDPGGVKRAQLWQEALEARLTRNVGFAFVDKRRALGVVGGGDLVAGDVNGATVLLFDDLIATGTTLARAAQALRRDGAARVVAFAAHGLFVEPAARTLADAAIERVVVADGVPAFRLPPGAALRDRLEIVSCAPLLAAVIRGAGAARYDG
jgi:ribose-phosphate pyrophosphokinase